MSCQEVLQEMNDKALRLIEPKVAVFPDMNCANGRVDLEYEFPQDLGFRVRSLVIPAHAKLSLFKEPDGYAELTGMKIITDVESLIDTYHMPGDQPCIEGIVCGSKLDWNEPSIRVERHLNFSKWLHINEVDLLDQWCTHLKDPDIDCSCHEADLLHRERYPKSHMHIHPGDLATNGCTGSHAKQQVPNRSQVHWDPKKKRDPTKMECQSHLHHLVKNGELNLSEPFKCGTHIFQHDQTIVDDGTYLWLYSSFILLWAVVNFIVIIYVQKTHTQKKSFNLSSLLKKSVEK